MSLYLEEEGEITLPFETKEVADLVVEAALEYEGCPYEAEINLLLTTDDEIHRMNEEFRQIDRATDVLRFRCWNMRLREISRLWKRRPKHLIRNLEN